MKKIFLSATLDSDILGSINHHLKSFILEGFTHIEIQKTELVDNEQYYLAYVTKEIKTIKDFAEVKDFLSKNMKNQIINNWAIYNDLKGTDTALFHQSQSGINDSILMSIKELEKVLSFVL